jgi:transcriptional regulator with XRE-family HTH domain
VDLPRLLADTLRQLRRDAGLTQTQMAGKLGISQPTLARLEAANQNVTIKTLGKLCRALRCEPGDLFRPSQSTLSRPPGAARQRPQSRQQ